MIGSLRASIDHNEKRITITAPTLMSQLEGFYGCEDIGIEGIHNFFYWNPISSLVTDFQKPEPTQLYYDRKPHNIAQCPRS